MSRPVRRSQAVAPFGIGSMVDFPGPVSLIHAGLDAWPFDPTNPDHREFIVPDEPRLARRLGVEYFVQPPDFRQQEHGGDTNALNTNLKLPFLRFPLWHACPRCGRMFEAKYHHRSPPECEGPIGSGGDKGKSHKKRRTVQVRFIAACTEGHMRDFPWIEWLRLPREEWHGIQQNRWLRQLSTGSASIAGVIIVAERRDGANIVEVARRSLAGAFSVDSAGKTIFSAEGVLCDGQNPALGIGHGGISSPADACGGDLRALLRGASNLYFSDVRSSIYVPEIEDSSLSQELLDLLEDHAFKKALLTVAIGSENGLLGPRGAAAVLRQIKPEASIKPEDLVKAVNRHVLHEILTGERIVATTLVQKIKASVDQLPTEEIISSVISDCGLNWGIDVSLLIVPISEWLKRRNGEEAQSDTSQVGDATNGTYRREEYRAFCRDGQDGFPKANLIVRSKELKSYGPIINKNFARIALLDKLRETRAFVGFSRIYSRSASGNADRSWRLISRERKNWLPAVVVRGEGIFLVFDEKRLDDWDNRYGSIHRNRLSAVNKNLIDQAIRRHTIVEPASPRFVLLHTFAHLLISQLVFDCGYGSSSLRERIYCSDAHPAMNGVLIYTAAGDSEGTMGGLVRMGEPENLEQVIVRALDRARWCSTDPVCIESQGQGPDNCNLAACHSCALLPETSCEQQNRLLDRGTVVGDLDRPEIGFFMLED